jgi:hypothetical protein
MTLLYNVKCDIYRDLIGDDSGGGAVVTGTLTIATSEPCRLDYFIPKASFFAPQGIETERIYSLFFRSTRQHPINVRENDYVKITFPPEHPEYNVILRVRGVQSESLHPRDPNRIFECTLVRIDESRGLDF